MKGRSRYCWIRRKGFEKDVRSVPSSREPCAMERRASRPSTSEMAGRGRPALHWIVSSIHSFHENALR